MFSCRFSVVSKGFWAKFLLPLGLFFPAPALGLCPANLSTAIEPIITAAEYTQGRWGIVIQTLKQPNSPQAPVTLYQRDGDKYFLVASNVKLFTTAAALQQFGLQYRIQTQVFGVGQGANWDWIRLVGNGDPTLTTEDLQKIAQGLWQQGIRKIDTLEITSLPFPDPPLNPTWALEDTSAGYIAPITRLALNRNALPLVVTPQHLGAPLKLAWESPALGQGWTLSNQTRTVAATAPESLETNVDQGSQTIQVIGQLRVGSEPETLDIPLLNPYPTILSQWRAALAEVGIQVQQLQFQHSPNRPMGQPLFSLASPPLPDILNQTNQTSDNFYAETLKQLIGAVQPGQMGRILGAWGISSQSYELVDGSGLSRQNWVTPQALVELLQAQRLSPNWLTFQNSLPQAGVKGTLRRRFLNTPAQGKVWAKTGTLRGVSALSGYAEPANFAPVVFSIVINQGQQDGAALRPGIDRIVVELMNLQTCP